MIGALLLPALLQAGGIAWGESEFLSNLHKAESRREADEELEYASRALRAWKPADGGTLKADALFRRGEALAGLYRFEEADSDLTDALELDSGNARAYLLRGRARLGFRHPAEASKDFKAYTAFQPSDPEGFLGLAQAYREFRQFEKARDARLRAEALSPADFRAPLEEARLWLAQNNAPRALSAFDKADALAEGRSAEVLSERAACKAGLGRTEQALADYAKALPLCDRRLEELARSAAPAPKLAEARSETAEGYYGRGRVNELLVKMEAALGDYRQACKLGHKKACARAEALSAKSEEPPRKPAPKKPVKPRKKRLPRIHSEPGERVYGS